MFSPLGSNISSLIIASIVLIHIVSCFSKCLIISIDNRELSSNINDNQYASMTAVVNLDYAKYHGYDFAYVQNLVTGLVDEANTKYPNNYVIPPTNIAKDVATAFHVGLKQFRAASWAKLPPIWHILTTIGSQYEYIWYIDSDATISPLHRNRTIEESVMKWERDGSVERGNPAVSQSAFIFFNNRPWRDDMPCAGSFIFRPSHLSTDAIVREWWDFNLPEKNFKHFHEQDALWHMIEAEGDKQWQETHPGTHFQLNSSTYSITTERQFPSAWTRYEDLWLCHVASYNYLVRMPVLHQFLRLIGRDSEETFKASVLEVQEKHTIRIKSLDVTERMESRSVQDASHPRLTSFPVHVEKSPAGVSWYDLHVTTKDLPIVLSTHFHEGRLLRRKGEFFLVCNGTRRGFANFDAFIALNLHKDLGHQVSNADVDAIPLGSVITAAEIAAAVDRSLICAMGNYSPLKDNQNHGGASNKSQSSVMAPIVVSNTLHGHTKLLNGSQSRDCEVDAAMEVVVLTPPTRSLLYLVSHDNASELLAHKFASCKESWVRPVRIQSTVFFESVLYRDVLPALSAEWEGLDYVVTATYKTVAKQLHYNGFNQNMDLIRSLLETAHKGQYDVVPFLRSGSGTISFCLYWHGKPFQTAWDALLQALGYSLSAIRALDETKPFYRNIFIIRPGVLKGLVEFMTRAMATAESDPHVKALLAVNANYKEGSEDVAMRIFGTKHYQLHPFIFERLPSFYLHSISAKICHYATEGPCKYNS